MKVLEAKALYKHYQEADHVVRAVDGVDISVAAKEFTVLAGPSGSGKTTLLNLIGCLDHPDSGEILIDGISMQEKTSEEMTAIRLHKIGFVFQAYNLIPVLSVYENIQFILQIQGVDEKQHNQRIFPLLSSLGLDGLHNRFPPQLSGGQQQRVAVARAIVGNPAIVLADEPTANLDTDSALSLLEMMKKLNREQGVTFLFSSHDQRVIDSARRIVRIRDGRVFSDETRPSALVSH
ncbi:MAG: ABC transporter ATP-binding protein [Candidatus Riflebacteria bacterium]|nr:ABC transporter ATP-binding protein [Candidatus Riflebacteria bacterium]